MSNTETALTLDESVKEVLSLLTGMDLTYDPRLDRYISITRALNRALRANALEHEWSYYSGTTNLGAVVEGVTAMEIPGQMRARIINDDAVRLVDSENRVRVWAYFLPRDALHKYGDRNGLWAATNSNLVMFSRPFYEEETELHVELPVMREPTMFRLPEQPEDPNEPLIEVEQSIRDQEIDFWYPDVIVARAAFMYAQTDPVMQPRVQTLEAQYKDLMYQVIERDDRNTESPYLNEFALPVQSGLTPDYTGGHYHPHSHFHGHG